MAYSFPVRGSVHPHTSLTCPPPMLLRGRKDARSTLWQGNVPAIPSTQVVLPIATRGLPLGCPFGPPPIGGPSSCTALTLKSKPAARKARHAQIPTRSFLEVSENILELLTRGSVTRDLWGSLRLGASGCQKKA